MSLPAGYGTSFFLLSLKGFVADLLAAFKGRLAHADPRQYNTVQRLAYLFVPCWGTTWPLAFFV